MARRVPSIHFPSARYEVDNSDSSGPPLRRALPGTLFSPPPLDDRRPRPVADGNASEEFMYRGIKNYWPLSLRRDTGAAVYLGH